MYIHNAKESLNDLEAAKEEENKVAAAGLDVNYIKNVDGLAQTEGYGNYQRDSEFDCLVDPETTNLESDYLKKQNKQQQE